MPDNPVAKKFKAKFKEAVVQLGLEAGTRADVSFIESFHKMGYLRLKVNTIAIPTKQI